MKIAFLAPANVIHTQRWVTSLSKRGIDLLLITQHDPGEWQIPSGVKLEILPYKGRKGYFFNVLAVRRALRAHKPDIVNCHYASGYGTLATLCRFHPTLLSVWGSDVYDFPYQSKLSSWLVRKNLQFADYIASTSHVMAKQVKSLVPSIDKIFITPFGVECNRFISMPQYRDHTVITIGTIKTLANKYGIDTLIDAFAILIKDQSMLDSLTRKSIRLLLVGDGPERANLIARVEQLNLKDRVTFVGKVTHEEVPVWLNRLDIYVAASRLDSESFGVAIIEASSCELPVVVSDVGGLPEVVDDGATGIVVNRNDSFSLSIAISHLVNNFQLRQQMGRAGRVHVENNYEWQSCVDQMIECYTSILKK